ncbi:BLUF domain-containing protein [Pontibacter silvestris]|uniref:BLUF domain-containing protein n=2 Tax=Pontibacter silvestris TaxID=2305183 RepID=A0ABW4WSE6_9BACT
MYHIMYVSKATVPLDENKLKSMLSYYRKNTSYYNITGLLLYGKERYIQEIEGEKENVHKLFDKITKDYHHQNIIKLADGEIKDRLFSEWYMGFATTSKEEFSHYQNYVDPTEDAFFGFLPEKDEESVVTVLKHFVTHNILNTDLI